MLSYKPEEKKLTKNCGYYKFGHFRYNYVTPTSYLELINTFKELLAKKRSEVLEGKRRYEAGLGKLDSTHKQVERMQEILVALQPKLIEAAKDVERMLASVESESEEVSAIERVVKKDEEAALVILLRPLTVRHSRQSTSTSL